MEVDNPELVIADEIQQEGAEEGVSTEVDHMKGDEVAEYSGIDLAHKTGDREVDLGNVATIVYFTSTHEHDITDGGGGHRHHHRLEGHHHLVGGRRWRSGSLEVRQSGAPCS